MASVTKRYPKDAMRRRATLLPLAILACLPIPFLEKAVDPTVKEIQKGNDKIGQVSGVGNEFMLLPLLGFREAAEIARGIIAQVLELKSDAPQLYNLNIPTIATEQPSELLVVPMAVARYGEHFIKRTDPRGRSYYWATNEPPARPEGHETDLTALAKGHITLTPLQYDMTQHQVLREMTGWKLEVPAG